MQLKPLLQRQDVTFVSLQYGDDKPHLQKFKKLTGINIIHDDLINPLSDMDSWLSQVAAMDCYKHCKHDSSWLGRMWNADTVPCKSTIRLALD